MKKIPILLIFLLIISLAAGVWFFLEKEKVETEFKEAVKSWDVEKRNLEDSLYKSKNNILELTSKLEDSRKNLRDAYVEIDTFDKKIKSLEETLSKSQQEIQALKKQVQERESFINSLKSEIRKRRTYDFSSLQDIDDLTYIDKSGYKISDDFSKDLVSWTQERDFLKEKLVELSSMLKTSDFDREDVIEEIEGVSRLLEERIIKMADVRRQLEYIMRESKKLAMERAFTTLSTVKLPPIVIHKGDEVSFRSEEYDKEYMHYSFIKDRQEASEVNRLEQGGKILLVNQAENFVVINLGLKDGVRKGMVFDVRRGNNRIGRIIIEDTRQNLSAGNIERVVYGEMFTANDRVNLAD